MSSTSHTILMVYGNEVFGENTRRVIEAVFGPCLNGDGIKSYVGETDPKPLAVVRPASSGAVPVALLEEVSSKLPELLFKVAYYEAAKGLIVGVTYSAGKASGGAQEVAVQPCGTQKAPEASSESVVPTTLQAIAEQHFKRGYSYIHEEIYTGCGIDYRDRYDMDEHFARYEAVKGLLEAGDREQCERTELHYKARASRLAARAKANFELHEALRHFAKPEVSCLLDAEDHDTLKRLEGVLVKVAPDFKAEFGSAPA
jgi:hypothetical protein